MATRRTPQNSGELGRFLKSMAAAGVGKAYKIPGDKMPRVKPGGGKPKKRPTLQMYKKAAAAKRKLGKAYKR